MSPFFLAWGMLVFASFGLLHRTAPPIPSPLEGLSSGWAPPAFWLPATTLGDMSSPSLHLNHWGPTLPARVFLSSEVLFQVVEGEAVLLELTRQRYFSLDGVGTDVWRMLEEDPDVERLVNRLLLRYDTTEAILRKDLLALFDRLSAAGLARVAA